MQIQKVKLISNTICYGPCPEEDDEVEQHLTISSTGRIWFTGYNFGGGYHEYVIGRRQQFSIGEEAASRILNLFSQYFEGNQDIIMCTDIGDWKLTITEKDKTVSKYQGSLCGGISVSDVDLSDYLRQQLSLDKLFAFDGGEYEEDDEDEQEKYINSSGNVILFPEYEELKKVLEKLRTELSMLVLEQDELQFVECKNIETAYILALGSLEYKAYKAQCALLRLKRKVELMQAKKNRQEKIILSQIENILDAEFAEYQEKLDEQMEKMNDAIKHSQAEFLSEADTRELKKLYRRIVKALHPDLHLDISSAQLRLFENAVTAYKNGDLVSLCIIDEMVSEPIVADIKEDAITRMTKEKERLMKLLQKIKDSIATIKSEYPYTVKELVQDQDQIEIRKAELNDILKQYEEAIATYSEKIKKMLR